MSSAFEIGNQISGQAAFYTLKATSKDYVRENSDLYFYLPFGFLLRNVRPNAIGFWLNVNLMSYIIDLELKWQGYITTLLKAPKTSMLCDAFLGYSFDQLFLGTGVSYLTALRESIRSVGAVFIIAYSLPFMGIIISPNVIVGYEIHTISPILLRPDLFDQERVFEFKGTSVRLGLAFTIRL